MPELRELSYSQIYIWVHRFLKRFKYFLGVPNKINIVIKENASDNEADFLL